MNATINASAVTKLNLDNTETRHVLVNEWSPRRYSVATIHREVVVWHGDRFQTATVHRSRVTETINS